jgi:phospholipid/cholesterol/gamma-HCH transport system ATP-binding protein
MSAMTAAAIESALLDPIIELRGVTKAFDGYVVYDNMSLDIATGKTTTIIGGSGTGKSVCMKLITGLLRADSGEVLVNGQEVTGLDAAGLRDVRRMVAYVFQGGALFDSMTVEDNIGYTLREHTKLGDEEIEARVMECIDMVALSPEIASEMPANLSGGEKKRVALARSIALRPKVILYDEPTTGLDPKNIAKIGDMIMKLQRELHVTSVVVTHDMPMAFRVSDRIAMLYDKAFPFVGTPDEISHSPVKSVRDFVHGRIDD